MESAHAHPENTRPTTASSNLRTASASKQVESKSQPETTSNAPNHFEELVRVHMVRQMKAFASRYKGSTQERITRKFQSQYELNYSQIVNLRVQAK